MIDFNIISKRRKISTVNWCYIWYITFDLAYHSERGNSLNFLRKRHKHTLFNCGHSCSDFQDKLHGRNSICSLLRWFITDIFIKKRFCCFWEEFYKVFKEIFIPILEIIHETRMDLPKQPLYIYCTLKNKVNKNNILEKLPNRTYCFT